MSFEDRLAEKLDRERVWGYTDDEKFNSEIARDWKRSAFNPYDFAPKTYSREEVAFDEARVAKIKKSPDYVREKSSESVALEYVLMEGIGVRGWFGDEEEVASVRKTAEYDDVFNGTDFVVTFESEDTGQLVSLAIDATTSADRTVLDRKEDRIIEKLSRGKMTEIKYFEDPDGKRGQAFMPRVVLGLNPEKTLKLQKMLVEKTGAAESVPEAGDFLRATGEQLLHFINYVLHRNSLLGEGRNIRTSAEAARFLDEHGDGMSGEIKQIIESHLAVLEIVAAVAEKKKIARGKLAIAS